MVEHPLMVHGSSDQFLKVEPIELFLILTGITKAMVCAIVSVI